MNRFFNNVMHPDQYHGIGKKGPFFEGWYYKLINSEGDQRWSIIPGVYIGVRPQDSHSFIQVMDGAQGCSHYIKFPFEQFHADEGKFHVSIGENMFSAEQIHLAIDTDDLAINGTLAFNEISSWPVAWYSPGIMGWFAWLPGMECYHGVVSLDHRITGSLTIDKKGIDFSSGHGYSEKDWGKAMPRAWVWLQCNHFNRPGISLIASVAVIPWGPFSFTGFIVGLLLDGHLYKFATYTGARLSRVEITDEQIHLEVINRRRKLQVSAKRIGGGSLRAPTVSQMDRRITESLSAEVDFSLSEFSHGTWQSVYKSGGVYAGLEVVGKL